MNLLSITTVYISLLLLLLINDSNASSPVLILAENSQQVITSTTLEWVTANKNLQDFDNAVIGGYVVRSKGKTGRSIKF